MTTDLYRLDLATLQWTSYADVAPPPPRSLPGFVAADDADWLFAFGGAYLSDDPTDPFAGCSARAARRLPRARVRGREGGRGHVRARVCTGGWAGGRTD